MRMAASAEPCPRVRELDAVAYLIDIHFPTAGHSGNSGHSGAAARCLPQDIGRGGSSSTPQGMLDKVGTVTLSAHRLDQGSTHSIAILRARRSAACATSEA